SKRDWSSDVCSSDLISCGDEGKEVIHYTFSVDEKQQLFISKSSEVISQEKLLQAVRAFYQSMSKDKNEKKQVLILDIADIKDLKAVEERIHPNTVTKWLNSNQQSKNSDEAIILEKLTNGVGAIKDKLTRDLLLSDTRLKPRECLISGISILASIYKAHEKDMTTKPIYKYDCD